MLRGDPVMGLRALNGELCIMGSCMPWLGDCGTPIAPPAPANPPPAGLAFALPPCAAHDRARTQIIPPCSIACDPNPHHHRRTHAPNIAQQL